MTRCFRTVALLVASAAVLAVAMAACGGDDDDDDDDGTPVATGATTVAAATPTPVPPTATPVPALAGEIIVFTATSLTDAFKEAGTKFTEKNPKAKVTFNFAASSTLATQINEGAPADIFVSADTVQMKVVTDKGNATASSILVTNVPVVVVAKSGSPITTFADLAKPGIRLVLAAPEVPVGKYSRDILTNAANATGGPGADFATKVLANLKSNEANVRAVLSKVQLGEADAGVVYTTDAGTATNDVKAIEIPAAYNILATYPVAVLKNAKNARVAEAFVAFLRSAEGQAILTKYGFGKPQ